jgi:hypothetical protein
MAPYKDDHRKGHLAWLCRDRVHNSSTLLPRPGKPFGDEIVYNGPGL